MKAANGFVWLWILLTFIWFAANSSLAPESIVTGALISARAGLLAYPQVRSMAGHPLLPCAASITSSCTRGVFMVELVRANINMMRYVYAPRIDIKPGVVEIKTKLEDHRSAGSRWRIRSR